MDPVISPPGVGRRLSYGWVNVVMASLAMTATLPGRTHGLGLITSPLLDDMDVSPHRFSVFNFWAILLGSFVCLPIGKAIDRFGTRLVGALVILALGIVVVLMSRVVDPTWLFVALFGVRSL